MIQRSRLLRKLALQSGLIVTIAAWNASPAWAALHRAGEDLVDVKIETQMQGEWRACQQGADCTLIRYGCAGTIAANKAFSMQATELAHRLGGDPTTVNCLTEDTSNYLASCAGHLCLATDPTE